MSQVWMVLTRAIVLWINGVAKLKTVKGKTFDEERALYGSDGICVKNCIFEGPADGESALKESRNVDVRSSIFKLRYPFWHNTNLKITGSEMTDTCRAALWYAANVSVSNCKLHGIKAVRECSDVTIEDCDIISPEFGWFVRDIKMTDTSVQSEYFMLRSDRLSFSHVTLKGKYSFQYIADSTFDNCIFDTKDAFWHARNVIVRNSTIRGEYLAWYCENVVFENCTIIGTQPLCYCKGLQVINCKLVDTDLAFERSEVEATIVSPVISIKNTLSGRIQVEQVGELILDDPGSHADIVVLKSE